ncbi:MAG: polysaccharide biosynthesis/export family protein [Planctomycetes bacterium]|nr:polysaccharide biosynthesis/export family protein [Planctomycetota bacterium]
MSHRLHWLLLVLFPLLLWVGCNQPATVYPATIRPSIVEAREVKQLEYLINVDDVIEVNVWQNQDVSRDAIVRPDGMISFPLIGEVKAHKRTLRQIDDEITQKLKEYIISPEVTVAIKKFAGEKVIVLGEVVKGGVHKFVGNASLMDIIGEAGGLTRDAKYGNLLIIRGDVLDKPEVVMVNVNDILNGDMRSNVVMYPNDIVYVSSKPIADVARYLRDYVAPVLSTIVSVEFLRTR